jgi:hypothetical protein
MAWSTGYWITINKIIRNCNYNLRMFRREWSFFRRNSNALVLVWYIYIRKFTESQVQVKITNTSYCINLDTTTTYRTTTTYHYDTYIYDSIPYDQRRIRTNAYEQIRKYD